MKLKFLKSYNRLIALFLSVLGVGSACSKASEYGTPAEEYGVPHANFKVQGKVTAADNKGAIEGIRVTMNYDTAFTDQNGNYMVINTSVPGTKVFQVKYQDVDLEVNGSYLAFDTLVMFEDPVFTGGDGNWYAGEVEKNMNVSLKPE